MPPYPYTFQHLAKNNPKLICCCAFQSIFSIAYIWRGFGSGHGKLQPSTPSASSDEGGAFWVGVGTAVDGIETRTYHISSRAKTGGPPVRTLAVTWV